MRIAALPRIVLPCAGVLLAAALAGCGGSPAPVPAAPQEEIIHAGDTTVRATVMQTSTLSEAIVERYGIERDDEVVMLMVGVRKGPEQASVPVSVTATATDLRGRRHVIDMRELHAGDLVDYVGTLRVDLPETLDFELEVRREGESQPVAPIRFSRDFHSG